MISEFELIARYFERATPRAVMGPGDDCALMQLADGMQLVTTTDMLVSGVHFFPDTDPVQLGWKTLAVNLSDLAAMGAIPRWVLLAVSLPKVDETWLAGFAQGLFLCADRYGVDLVGGDTTRGPLTLCVTAIGEVPTGKALCRHHAQPGDDIWVSGQPGLAGLALAHLQGHVRLPENLAQRCISALQQPVPKVELGTALRREAIAHAAIDMSDGLLADLDHIAECSDIDATLFLPQLPALPEGVDPELARQCQLAGGDDYELIFTAAASSRNRLAALAEELSLPLWQVGQIGEERKGGSGGNVFVHDCSGNLYTMDRKGFDHFA